MGIVINNLFDRKNEEIFVKGLMKICKNGYFRHFRPEKKFLKIGLGHVLGFANTHLCAKNQKKQLMKSRENAKNPVFSAYFRHFRQGKYDFSKIGLGQILDITSLHQCAKFHEKI